MFEDDHQGDEVKKRDAFLEGSIDDDDVAEDVLDINDDGDSDDPEEEDGESEMFDLNVYMNEAKDWSAM